jgi:hypothetical protein
MAMNAMKGRMILDLGEAVARELPRVVEDGDAHDAGMAGDAL